MDLPVDEILYVAEPVPLDVVLSFLPLSVALNERLELCAPATATPIARLGSTSRTMTLVSRLDMSLPSDKRDGCCATSMTRGPGDPSRLCPRGRVCSGF